MCLYYKVGVELSTFVRLGLTPNDERGVLRNNSHLRIRLLRLLQNISPTLLSRNVVQFFFTSTVLFWPCYDVADGWSYKLRAVVPLAALGRLLYKGLAVRDPTDVETQNWSLSGSPGELLLGPLQLALVYVYLALSSDDGAVIESIVIASAMLGDNVVAPFVGARYGRHLYSVPLSKTKTMEGSVVGVFLGTVVGCYLYMYLYMYIVANHAPVGTHGDNYQHHHHHDTYNHHHNDDENDGTVKASLYDQPLLPLRVILTYAAIAAVAEGTSPSSIDNIVITTILHFSIEPVQRLLPP
jgi:CDP-diglyceride synthetase